MNDVSFFTLLLVCGGLIGVIVLIKSFSMPREFKENQNKRVTLKKKEFETDDDFDEGPEENEAEEEHADSERNE
jgi:hypothetical protein